MQSARGWGFVLTWLAVGFLAVQVGCGPGASKTSKPMVRSAEVAQPSVRQPDKPAEKPVSPPEEKPAPKPEQKAAAKPTDDPFAASSPAPAAKPPADDTAKKPAAGPLEKPKPMAAPEFPVPLGLPKLPIPADNPMTAEKIELGKMLYFDKRVSKDGTVSCATCHDPKLAWAEHDPTSTGIKKQVGGRNSPTVINAAYAPVQFWDGRAATLEEQAVGPVENPIEMGHSMENLVGQLDKIPEYHRRFEKVFATPVTKEGFAKAVAAFERTVLSGDSPYDRFKAGDEKALTDAQKRGLEVFQTAGCVDCHVPPLFSTYEYHNAGVGMDKPKPDEGRKTVSKKDEDLGAFRVVSLRNVADTAPYFHDGGAKTLEEAVALMAAGGKDNPHRSAEFDAVRKAKITPEQQKDLVEFLKALSGKYPVIDPPALP